METAMENPTQTTANKPQNHQTNIRFDMGNDILVGDPKRWHGDSLTDSVLADIALYTELEDIKRKAAEKSSEEGTEAITYKRVDIVIPDEVVSSRFKISLDDNEQDLADAQALVESGHNIGRTPLQRRMGSIGLGMGAATASAFALAACHGDDPPVCALSSVAESCWDQNTGVKRNDGSGIERWTTPQILSGQAGLTRAYGQVILDVAGATYENMWVDGCISVRNNNITIQNVLVRGGNNCPGGLEPNETSGLIATGYAGGPEISGLKVYNSVIVGTGIDQDTVGIGASNYTIEGSDISGTVKGFKTDHNVIVSGNYIHNLAASWIHGEAMFMGAGPGNVIVHNNWMRAQPNGANSGAIALYNEYAGNSASNIYIVQNYLDGADNGVGFRGGAYINKPGNFYYGMNFSGNVIESNFDWPDYQVREVEAWCDYCPDNVWGDPTFGGPNVDENGVPYSEPTPITG